MTGLVYLVKKDDLFKIGQSKDVSTLIKRIKPDEVVETIEVKNPNAFEARLLRRYRHTRLPETGYFNFSDKELLDCKKQFSNKTNIPKTIDAEFDITLTGSLFLFFIVLILNFKLQLGLLTGLSLAISISSLPMWILFLIGNFGGYYSDDIPLFSSWLNRIKAFLFAILLSLLSYFVYRLTFA